MLGDDDGPSNSDDRYYVKRASGKVFGPFDPNAIQMMLEAGKIGSDAAVSTDKEDWRALADIPEFAEHADEESADQTQIGGFAAAGSDSQREPSGASDGDDGPGLPTPAGGSENDAGPELPTPKSGSDASGGAGLPKPKSESAPEGGTGENGAPPDLPTPKDEPGDSGGGPPDLPTSKEEDSSPPGSNSPELPASKQSGEDLPRSADENLPTSGASGEELPRSADENLPTSGAEGEGLPRSADENLPKSGEPAADLPRSSDDNLPDSAEATASESVEAGGEEDLFGDGPDEDLFAEDDADDAVGDDLFGGGDTAGAEEELGGPDEDLFAVDDAGGEDDLFGEGTTGDESGDDLFGAEEEEEDDLFAESQTDGEQDLFEASAPHAATAPDEGRDEEEADLFEPDEELEIDEEAVASETPEPEASASASGTAADAGPRADDDFSDEELELDTGAAQRAGVEADGARPKSRGIAERERRADSAEREAAPEGEEAAPPEKDGTIGRVVVLLGILAVAVPAAGLYYWWSNREPQSTQSQTKTSRKRTATVDLGRAREGTYPALEGVLESTQGADLSKADRGKHLLVAALFLSRYDSKSVEKRAKSVADALEDASEGYPALGRGAWAASDGNLEVAQAYLEPLYETNDEKVSYFAHLVGGIAHVKALERRSDRAKATERKRADLPPTAEADSERPEAVGGGTLPSSADSADPDAGATSRSDTGGDAGAETGASAADDPSRRPKIAREGGRLLKKAREKSGGVADPDYWIGRLREAERSTDRALESYLAALKRQKDHVPSHLRAGRLHYAAGRLGRALEHAETILGELGSAAGPPDSAAAYHLVGSIEAARSKNGEAIKAFRSAIEKDADRSNSIRMLAEVYDKSGRFEEGLEFFESNDALGEKDPEVLLGMVRFHMGLEQWQSAINVLERGEKKFPENARFPYLLGKLHRERGAFTEAKKAMQRAIQNDPKLLEAYATLAQLSWQLDQNPQHGAYYIRQITRRPGEVDASVATKVGEFYRISDRRAIAQKWYREALERDPNHFPARLQLAKLFLEHEEGNEALRVLEKARDSGVEDLRLSAYLADAYRQTEKYDRALKAIGEVLDRKPDDAQYVFIRGLIHFDRGNYQNARRDFIKARELDPLFHRAYFYTGRAAFAQGKYKNALKILRQVLDDHPEVGEYRYWMGRILEERGRPEDALEEYRKVTKYEEGYGVENPELYVRRGQLLVEIGYAERGKKEIARALEVDSELTQARLAMAEAHYATKNYETAIEQYERALKSKPKVPEAQRKLGMALVYVERKREGAGHLQKAVEYGHEDPGIYETLGYLYKELGQPDLAVRAFKSYLRETKGEDVPRSTRREMIRQIEELGG